MTTKTEITPTDLTGFTGTENYYRHLLRRSFHWTDGVQYLAKNAGAFWLIDLIASHQGKARVRKEGFQVWTLELNEDGNGAVAYMQSDTGCPRIVEQKIEYTDFPAALGPKFEMFLVDGSIDGENRATVLMLKSEY